MPVNLVKISAYVGLGEAFLVPSYVSMYNKTKIQSIADEVLEPNKVLKSLGKLAEGHPTQLPDRVCSERVLQMTPALNCGNLGCEKRNECAARITALSHLAAIGVGVSSGAVLGAYLFKSCLSQPGATLGFCAEEFNTNFLVGKLGFALGGAVLCGYYLSRILIYTRLFGLSRDLVPGARVQVMKQEYETLGTGLKTVLGRTIDPKEIAMLHRLAKKLLDNLPAIQQAICQSASLEKEEAAIIVVPLETACRHVLNYQVN